MGAGAHRGGRGLGFLLAAVGRMVQDGRALRVHRALRGVGGVCQQQRKLGQGGAFAMAGVVGQGPGAAGHAGLFRHAAQLGRHPLCAGKQPHAAGPVLRAVAAQRHRHVGRRQHGRQHGPLGGVEGIKLVNVHAAAGKKVRVQLFGGQLHPVAGVHAGVGQKPLVGGVDQRQLGQLVPVGAGGVGVGGQGVGSDAGAFQLVDGPGGLLAEGGALALAAVIDHLVQQRVQRAAHQHGAAGLGQGGHRRAAVPAQQRLGQRGEGVTFHIAGQGIPQQAVERAFGGGGELFRHDQDAAAAGGGVFFQLPAQKRRLAAAGGA